MKIKFLIADEFRQEMNYKVTALGLFPDDTVIFIKGQRPANAPDNAPTGIERLSIMVVVSDIEGSHSYKGKIVDPNGQMIGKEHPFADNCLVKEGMSQSFVFEMKPFIFQLPGIYKFIFYIDDQPKEFPFEMRMQS